MTHSLLSRFLHCFLLFNVLNLQCFLFHLVNTTEFLHQNVSYTNTFLTNIQPLNSDGFASSQDFIVHNKNGSSEQGRKHNEQNWRKGKLLASIQKKIWWPFSRNKQLIITKSISKGYAFDYNDCDYDAYDYYDYGTRPCVGGGNYRERIKSQQRRELELLKERIRLKKELERLRVLGPLKEVHHHHGPVHGAKGETFNSEEERKLRKRLKLSRIEKKATSTQLLSTLLIRQNGFSGGLGGNRPFGTGIGSGRNRSTTTSAPANSTTTTTTRAPVTRPVIPELPPFFPSFNPNAPPPGGNILRPNATFDDIQSDYVNPQEFSTDLEAMISKQPNVLAQLAESLKIMDKTDPDVDDQIVSTLILGITTTTEKPSDDEDESDETEEEDYVEYEEKEKESTYNKPQPPPRIRPNLYRNRRP